MKDQTNADRLISIREWLGYANKADLARALGIEPPRYRQWESPQRAKASRHIPLELVEKLAALARAKGLDAGPVYTLAGYDVREPVSPRGLADHGAARYVPAPRSPLHESVAAWQRAGINRESWVMRDRGLTHAGVLPGDVAVVDLSQHAFAAGELVLASINGTDGYARSVLRLLRPPFLVAVTADESLLTPVLVDESRVVLRGHVIAVVRQLLR